ncbi:MAG: class I SAM-dependent methyltransferase [Saprospiraceae bacterium]|nr:class I SAM-dependent methyltransferase [Saprospiraceae bacterium]
MSDSIFRKDGTAQGVAKQRLIESLAKPDQRVIYDPNADKFVAGAGIIKLMGHRFSVWLTKKFAPGFHEHLISRTRFIDDLVQNAAAQGVEQYVILGAGYDLRAHRLNLPPTLEIFEVDQQEVQNRKRSKLPSNVPNLENVKYVSVDFNHQSLKKQLLEAGFDQSKSAIFTLEGVSQYISKEAVNSTLEELAELTKNTSATFYISYVDSQLQTDPAACFGTGYPHPEKKAKTIMNLAAKVGEPWISFYSAEEIKEVLSQYGFSLMEDKTLVDFNSEYFAPIGRKLLDSEILNLEHSVRAERKKLTTTPKLH